MKKRDGAWGLRAKGHNTPKILLSFLLNLKQIRQLWGYLGQVAGNGLPDLGDKLCPKAQENEVKASSQDH